VEVVDPLNAQNSKDLPKTYGQTGDEAYISH
jgi:hypothetical protein